MSNILARLLLWSQAFSIRAKIIGLSVMAVLLMGLSASLLAQSSFLTSTTAELERRAGSIARDVDARGVEMLLTQNALGLHELLTETLSNNEDVRYVVILDAKGRVAAHTFGNRFPGDLLELPRPEGSHTLVSVIETEEGRLHDVALPILEGRAGTVRVGMSPQRLHRAAMTQTEWMALTMLGVAVLAIISAWMLTLLLTRPIAELVAVSQAATGGDLSRRVPPGPPDEIGLLSHSLNEMLTQLQTAHRIRTELLDRIIMAQEDERRRIARELHDETSQAITSIVVGLRALEVSHPEVLVASTKLRQLAATTLNEIHSLILELRPRALDELGLVAALKRYVADFGQKHGIRAEFHAVEQEGRLPPAVETCLYRVVQEALTNVARHAEASATSVVLDLRPPVASAIIEDDGRGFDPQKVGPQSLGLVGMRERTALLSGSFTIETSPGSGTSVYVKIPLKENKP